MTNATVATLIEALRQYHVLDSAQADELRALQTIWPEPRALAAELRRRGRVTAYQIHFRTDELQLLAVRVSMG